MQQFVRQSADKSNKSRRIARNTTVLYLRMIVVMLVGLYTVRIVIDSLGFEDYGIYNVVAGIIILLNCLNRVLSSATQRFYSYSIGKGDSSYIQNVFSVSFKLYIIVSLAVILLGETIGVWFVNTQLVIPSERLFAANWIYQFSIFSFVLVILSVPFSAMIIAHEDMNLYAGITLMECGLKLLSALLLYVFLYDRLILYGFLLLLTNLATFVLYVSFCKKKYIECHYAKVQDKGLFVEMLSFSGWTLYGSVAGVLNVTGNTILVNLFFGPIVNAARAVALQINTALETFNNSFIVALQPPMIKSYADGDSPYLMKLFYFSNKFVFYSMMLICMPCFFEMDTILGVWLKDYTHDMVTFSKIILLYSVILSLHHPITIIMRATGNVRRYFVPVESFTLLSMPLTYLFFYKGFPAVTTFIIMVFVFFLAHIMRLVILKKAMSFFSLKEYSMHFVLPAFLVTSVTFTIVHLIWSVLNKGIDRVIVVGAASTILLVGQVFLFVLSKEEKSLIKKIIKKK